MPIKRPALAPQLRLVGEARARAHGGYCLDGSPPGFWYDPPAVDVGGSDLGNRSWLLFLDGGSWCYDEHDCESRAKGFKGSSRGYPPRYWPYSGPMDARPSVNPTFARFHRVLLGYCDGSSFLSDRTAPLVSSTGGAPLYMRGRRVLEAQVAELLDLGLRDATHVLFSGGSAGGLGALHAANAVQQLLPRAEVFKVLLLSGFFLMPPSRGLGAGATCTKGRDAARRCVPWAQRMRGMCMLHNCTPTLRESHSDGCGAHRLAADSATTPAAAGRWRCMFPAASLPRVRAPVFIINSALDSWQLVNVWRRFYRCRYDSVGGCSAQQTDEAVSATNTMLDRFVSDLRLSGALSRAGHGAFVTSCNEHVGGLSPEGFGGFRIGDARAARTARAVRVAPTSPQALVLALP
jgi:hypothetical protein